MKKRRGEKVNRCQGYPQRRTGKISWHGQNGLAGIVKLENVASRPTPGEKRGKEEKGWAAKELARQTYGQELGGKTNPRATAPRDQT